MRVVDESSSVVVSLAFGYLELKALVLQLGDACVESPRSKELGELLDVLEDVRNRSVGSA